MSSSNVNDIGNVNERPPPIDDTTKTEGKSSVIPSQPSTVDEIDDLSTIANSLPIQLQAENPNLLKNPGYSETPAVPPAQFTNFTDLNTAKIYIGMRQLQLTTFLDLAVSAMKDSMDKTLTSAKMDLDAAEKQKEAKELEAWQSTVAGISSAINGTVSLAGACYASSLSLDSSSVSEEELSRDPTATSASDVAKTNQSKLQKAKMWMDSVQQFSNSAQQVTTGALKGAEANKSFSASQYRVMSDVVKNMADQLKELFKQIDQFFDSISTEIVSAANTTAAVFQTMSRI